MADKIYTFDDAKTIAKLLKTKKKAAVVETDTVMGIISLNADLIYQIKRRPQHKRLISFVSDSYQIKSLTSDERRIIKPYWPGPLTIVKDSVSYRIPDHKQLLELIKLTGPIFSSSANISNCDPVKDINEALEVFAQNEDRLIFVEGKNLTNKPSTIVNLDERKILREGAIDGKEIIKKLWES